MWEGSTCGGGGEGGARAAIVNDWLEAIVLSGGLLTALSHWAYSSQIPALPSLSL